jgi:hypothetical protein
MAESSPRVSLSTIGVISGLALNLVGLIGVAIALGQWKGEIQAAMEHRATDMVTVRESQRMFDVELRILTARIAANDAINSRLDQRLMGIEAAILDIKNALRPERRVAP